MFRFIFVKITPPFKVVPGNNISWQDFEKFCNILNYKIFHNLFFNPIVLYCRSEGRCYLFFSNMSK